MATVIGANNLTLMDIAKLTEPGGGIVNDIGEMLTQDNEILQDATFMEANGGTYHRHSQRIGIPEPTWRRYYEGVIPIKGAYATLDEPLGMMEARSVVDEDLVKHSGNPAQVRMIEAGGIMEGFNQHFTETLLYGNVSASPAKFNGILPRFSSLSAASGENVIDAGGTGTDNASILLVNWGPRSVFCVYPKGSQAGLSRQDLGVQQVLDSNSPGRRFSAYEEIFKWQCGLVVKDWRHIVRIANIDKSLLVAQSGAAALINLMIAAVDKLPSGAGGRAAFYASRTVHTMLRIQIKDTANVHLSLDQVGGKRVASFDGIPIRKVDQMQADESRVT